MPLERSRGPICRFRSYIFVTPSAPEMDIDGGPILLREAGYAGQVHLAYDVKLGFIGGAEDFELGETMPAGAELVHDRRTDGANPRAADVARAAKIVALVVAPEGHSGFVGVVTDVAAGDLIFGRESVIHAAGVAVLCWTRR